MFAGRHVHVCETDQPAVVALAVPTMLLENITDVQICVSTKDPPTAEIRKRTAMN